MRVSNGSTVPTSKPKINAYISHESNDAIELLAKQERRSKSQMIEILLEEALQARGLELVEGEHHANG